MAKSAPLDTSQHLHVIDYLIQDSVCFVHDVLELWPAEKTVRQCRVLVDQPSCLYDCLDSLPHFLKNGDCLKLSALGTEVNWNLALGDFSLPCFPSL